MEELKFIQPFMQRAQELAEREPVIAYYCHFYAAKLAIESPVKSPESQAFLTQLLDTLERVICFRITWTPADVGI
jgi:vacuolar protein sorting-associated protein VTA1